MKSSKKAWRKSAIVLGFAACAIAAPAIASHSWNGYHWKRTTSEISPPVGDNVTSQWDSYLNVAIADWNQSTVINSAKVPGSAGDPKQCNAVAGTIQVCNASYGQRGWLGIATIWLSGGHIAQGTTKLNDTYFNMAQYNTPSWRALVTCQEIGHDYGLGHQDENFSTDNTNSCMDYTNLPAGNEHPDAHDYQQLLSIYNHLESASSAMLSGGRGAAPARAGDTPAEWGRAIHFTADGRPDVFETQENGMRKITHVLWAIGEGPQGGHHD
jgi:hypothetical protein